MAALKRVGVWDLQLGMIVVKCDKSGVPFYEYGKPLSNLGFIHNLYEYGVEHVYIWHDDSNDSSTKQTSDINMEFTVSKQDDIKAVELSVAKELVYMLWEIFNQSMDNFSHGKPIDAPAITNLVQDIVFMSNDNPDVFTKIMVNEGMSKDEYSHSLNVCINAISLGQAIGLNKTELYDLGVAAIFHDIGKVRVPEHILKKKAGLTEYEFAVIKRHPEYAEQILQRYDCINENMIHIIFQHHEYCDGTGYPSGITAQYISKPAQVLAVAEAYNSMLIFSNEYPRAFNNADAIKKIYAESGKKFQADIVKTFVTIMGVYPVGTAVTLSDNSIAIVCEVNKSNQACPKVLAIDKNDNSKIKLINLQGNPSLKIVRALNSMELTINPFEIFMGFLQNRVTAQLA